MISFKALGGRVLRGSISLLYDTKICLFRFVIAISYNQYTVSLHRGLHLVSDVIFLTRHHLAEENQIVSTFHSVFFLLRGGSWMPKLL